MFESLHVTMSATKILWFLLVLVAAAAVVAAGDTPAGEGEVVSDVGEEDGKERFYNSTVLSPAEELIRAAEAAGYELTLDRLDEAVAASDEEVERLMPAPVAEAFISMRRRDSPDDIREKMIGMIFTGRPQPLGPRPPRLPFPPPIRRSHLPPPRQPNPRRQFPPNHPNHNPHSKPKPLPPRRGPPPHPAPHRRNNPFPRLHVQYNPQEVPSPQEILKPLPFEPGPTMVKFPPHHPGPDPSPPHHNHKNPSHGPPPHPPSHSPDFPGPVEDFSNTVGPDFGPVSFSEFGGNFGFQNNFENDFGEFHSEKVNSRPHRPPPPGPRPSNTGGPRHPPPTTPSKRPPPPPKAHPPAPHRPPPRPRPSPHRPAPRPPSRPQSHPRPHGSSNKGESCVKYTEDICLDTEKYPHEAILSSLVRDPARADTMVAEVRSQSADDLVDGVTAAQESKYDFQHYFGNRRSGTDNHAHRDFAQDGGFLCPSEVKYARPKRARNSKGDWKFVVNMDKYTQTIRMEKCLKPGGACSYVSHHYRATCNQVYNYHRLLSWDEGRGLHMDIFKVPSCCSCHIQGYAYIFPPLSRHQNTAFSNDHSVVVPAPMDDLEAPAFSPIGFPKVPPLQTRRTRPRTPPHHPHSHPHPTPENELRSRTQQIERAGEEGKVEEGRGGGVEGRRGGGEGGRGGGGGGGQQEGDERRRGHEDSRVNYGYHPIIDFFDSYSDGMAGRR